MVKKIVISCAIVLVGLAVFLSVFEMAYAEQLLPGITIGGQGFRGQNKTAISMALKKNYDQTIKQGIILINDNKHIQASLDQMGISFNYQAAVDQAFALSHSQYFGLGTLKTIWAEIKGQRNFEPPIIIDQTIKQKFITEIVHKNFSLLPTDAALNITENAVSITDDKDGIWVMDDQLWTNIETAINNHQMNVKVPTAKKVAEVKPADLGTAKSDAENLIARNITLTANYRKITVTKSDLIPWIIVKPDSSGTMRAAIDPEKVKSYLNDSVAGKVTQKSVNDITSTNGDMVKVGQDGIDLKIDESVAAITDALSKPNTDASIKLVLAIQTHGATVVDPLLGCNANVSAGKYIDINLTMQKMCLFDGGTLVNTYGVSTGKWSTPTPEGTFAIQNKMNPAYSQPYDLWMPYWSAITPDGQYGIHGLPYRGNWIEGQGHIGTPVSHGCIRLGAGNDAFVYDWAIIGTPVYIHK